MGPKHCPVSLGIDRSQGPIRFFPSELLEPRILEPVLSTSLEVIMDEANAHTGAYWFHNDQLVPIMVHDFWAAQHSRNAAS